MATSLRAIAPVAATLLALFTGGCQTLFNAVGVEYPATASEAHKFDGSYQGDISQVSSTGSGCPAEHGERVIMVGDGVLWYAYTPGALFAAPINQDGVIAATLGDTVMSGNVTGNHLTATVKSPTCETQLSMDYILNHS